MKIDDIIDDFEYLDDWEDRYKFVIELGKDLAPLPAADRTEANKVHGCVSQVWLAKTEYKSDDDALCLSYVGDSDALIVRGLVAIVFAIYSGAAAEDIVKTDAMALLEKLGLQEHLTPQRSNGLASMVRRIKTDAEQALARS